LNFIQNNALPEMPFKAFWLRIIAAHVFECIFKQESFPASLKEGFE
jgi:hypothetical protein